MRKLLSRILPKTIWEGPVKMRINPIILTFEPALEKEFNKEYFTSSIVFVRISFIFGILFYACYAYLDYRVSPDYLATLFTIRFYVVCPVILLVFLLSYLPGFRRYWQAAIFCAVMIAGSGIVVMLINAPQLLAQSYYVGLILVFIYGYFLIKLHYIYASISGLLLTMLYLAVDYKYLKLPGDVSFSNGFFLVSSNIILMFGSYFIEYYTRRDFYSRYLLKQERNNIELINKDLEQKVINRTKEIDEINSELRRKIEKLNRSEQELRENEEQIRLAFDASNATIWGMELQSMKLLLNEVCIKILDYPLTHLPEFLGIEDIHKEEQSEFRQALEKIIIQQTESIDLEFRLQSYNGDWKWLHAWGKVSDYNLENQPTSIVGTLIDVTIRKENELELTKYRQNLEKSVRERTASLESSQQALVFLTEDMNLASEKLAKVNRQMESVNKELESFSYSVSHDLKAPLRAIDGFSRALEEDYESKLDEDGQEYLHLIRTNTGMMIQLIQDLLEFSRLGRKVIVPVEIDLVDLINQIYTIQTRELVEREIELELDDLPVIKADINLIRQVFVNLLSNAIKFTSTRETAKITVDYKSKGKEHIISVRDNGVGFNMRFADKLFGVFQRLHSAEEFEGYGVGLSLAKRIITKHGGSIWAESEIDKGATFFISLPKDEEESKKE